jgi:hypothetical protein
MPTITASADELPQRLTQAKDVKQRQRLPALYLVVSGHARSRQDLATLSGVHRHSGAAWLAASAAGGVEQRRRYHVPQPPSRNRSTPTALA